MPGHLELVVSSESDYVNESVRLATVADYRDAVAERIRQARDTLFEDDGEIRDLEVFLAGAPSR